MDEGGHACSTCLHTHQWPGGKLSTFDHTSQIEGGTRETEDCEAKREMKPQGPALSALTGVYEMEFRRTDRLLGPAISQNVQRAFDSLAGDSAWVALSE